MRKKSIYLSIIIIFLIGNFSYSQELTPKTKKAVKKAIDKGLRFLRYAQKKEGHWDDPGITALAITAFLRSPRKYGLNDGPWIRKPLAYIAKFQKKSGGIYRDQLANYNTSVAIMAFTSNKKIHKKYKHVVEKAKKFLIKLQCDEGEGYTPKADRFYGGIGYGGDERPDLSNTQYALEALKAAGLDKNHPVYKKAIVFLERCQNRSESNDLKWAGNDGGFVYYPGSSKAGKYTEREKIKFRSYGSMTYAGIKSYIYANLKKDDPRVKAAYNWVRRNYDLSQNPGAGQQGLFYYYHTFAKTLYVLDEKAVVDYKGNAHNWREDLAKMLLKKQKKNGAWVNPNSRWWEADPRLVTAYAVMALSLCYEKK